MIPVIIETSNNNSQEYHGLQQIHGSDNNNNSNNNNNNDSKVAHNELFKMTDIWKMIEKYGLSQMLLNWTGYPEDEERFLKDLIQKIHWRQNAIPKSKWQITIQKLKNIALFCILQIFATFFCVFLNFFYLCVCVCVCC